MVDFEQLTKAVEWSVKQLETPRRKRVDAIKEFVGAHYASGGSDKRVPTNFLELAATIYIRLLAASAPRAIITTSNRALRPFAKSAEIAINQLPEEIGLASTLRRAVLEALFSFGVVKVGTCSNGETVLGHDIGEPYADIVPLDDYFMDMSAKSMGDIQFEGNDYWISKEDAERIYKAELTADDHTVVGEQGETRAESITTPEGADLYRERVWLRDVYIHHTNQLVTYTVKSKKELRVKDWDGPEGGPYHKLGFSDVPGNLLPLPPVALWMDLHELANALFRKLGKQADRKKTVAAFSGSDDEAVERLKMAQDGDGIKYNGQKPEQITVGGIDPQSLAFFLQVQDLFDYFGGNLNVLGGLGPSTDTVGQDRLLSEAAGARAQDMAQQTINFARGIFKALAWYEWTDPVRKRQIEKPIGNTGLTVQSEWSYETRQGDFLDYNFNIDVYSMQDNSPATRLQKLGLIMQTYVMPLAPIIQSQGGSVDAQVIIDLVADLSNFPELKDIVKFTGVVPESQQVVGNMQPQTTRRYERVNRPGATRSGRNAVLSQVLMGGTPQPNEAATLARRVS